MKKIIVNSLIILAILCGIAVGAVTCTHNEPVEDSIVLVKNPDILVYSGNYIIGNTKTNRWKVASPNSNQWEEWGYVIPNQITEEERAKVLEVFNQKGEEHYESLIDWSNFFVQQVYCGPEGAKMTELATVVDYKVDVNVKSWWPYEADTIVTKVDPFDDIVNNYNNGSYSGNKLQGLMLMLNSATNSFGFKSTQGGGERFYNFRMEYINGAYYVGFDFQSNKQGSDANNNELFERDYIYNDWIIKIVPADGITPEIPSIDEPIESIDTICDHVEVNLEYDKDKLTSHLSIHIRSITDVEIFIPVPITYTCELDDVLIVMKHERNHMVHKTEYKLKDSDLVVILNVEYTDEGIRITTDGVTQEVIDWCYEKCRDGITFEVWNYYNDIAFIDFLNYSTIEFLDNNPCQYINAYNEINNKIHEEDCSVDIIDYQKNLYTEWEYGYFYNSSHYNRIYSRK